MKTNGSPRFGYLLVVAMLMVALSRVVSPGAFGPDTVVCFGSDGHVALELRHNDCAVKSRCAKQRGRLGESNFYASRAQANSLEVDHRFCPDLCRDVSLPSAPSSVSPNSDCAAKRTKRRPPIFENASALILNGVRLSGKLNKHGANLRGGLFSQVHLASTGLFFPYRMIWLL